MVSNALIIFIALIINSCKKFWINPCSHSYRSQNEKGEWVNYSTYGKAFPTIKTNNYYGGVPGKRPWAHKHNVRFWPTWALTSNLHTFV